MSIISLAEAKAFLNVIHSDDDAMLQLLLDGAEDQALRFMNRDQFGELAPLDSNYTAEVENLPEGVRAGIYILLQTSYQTMPDDMAPLRRAAEVMLMPWRIGVGM